MIDKIDLNYQPSNPIELSFVEELNVVDILNELIETMSIRQDDRVELIQRFVSEYKELKGNYDPKLVEKVEDLQEEVDDLESEIDQKKDRINDLESEVDSLREENQELDSKCDLLQEQLEELKEYKKQREDKDNEDMSYHYKGKN